VSVWDSLKTVLARLLDEQPGTFTSFPDPRVDRNRRPPFRIGLAAWASDTAAELHNRFGADVELTVGALPYPPGSDQPPAGVRQWLATHEDDTTPMVDTSRIRVEPSDPLSVRTGHTQRHELLLANRTESELALRTNGALRAVVVDPGTDRVVGGVTGAQHAKLVLFRIPPGVTGKIPLVVGTASFDPALGYAVPPGKWAARATLAFDGLQLSTPLMPLTVTP
jgi:hypothetical protein